MADQAHILSGYRVLDFTQVVAGPTVTRLMAEMGAEVIKVELAPGGDLARLLPFIRDGRSGYFVQQNRGKHSLCVDARSAEGRQILRDLAATVDVLVERGIVTSGETLARVIPQFTSGLRAAAFDDPLLRRHYAAIYRAFRRRRSLLLLNLEKQVRIEELPWVEAMEPFRRTDLSVRELSHRALKEVAMLTLRAFPQAIIPNKLLQEFRALAQGAAQSIEDGFAPPTINLENPSVDTPIIPR